MKEIHKHYLRTFGMIAGEIRNLTKYYKIYNKRLKMLIENQEFQNNKVENLKFEILNKMDVRLHAHQIAHDKLFNNHFDAYSNQTRKNILKLNSLILKLEKPKTKNRKKK